MMKRKHLPGIVLMALLSMPVSPWAQAPTPNGRIIDPSPNVQALNEAAQRRQDDLRAASEKLIQAELAAAEKLNEYRNMSLQRLAAAEAKRLDSEAKLRAEYAERLDRAEAGRLDAIRLVDTSYVAASSTQAAAIASTLAKTVSDTAMQLSTQAARQAEDLRLLVKTTADEQTRNLQQQFTAVQNQFTSLSSRITVLEQTASEGRGKQTFQDPAFIDLLKEVKALTQSRASVAGTEIGRGEVIAWLIGGLALLIAFGSLVVAFRKNPAHVVRHSPARRRRRR